MMAMMIKAKETEILSQNATLRQTHRRNYGQKSHINRNCYQSRRVVCLLKLHECDRRTDWLACNQLISWSGQRPFLPLSVSLSPSLWNSQHNSGITRKDLYIKRMLEKQAKASCSKQYSREQRRCGMLGKSEAWSHGHCRSCLLLMLMMMAKNAYFHL